MANKRERQNFILELVRKDRIESQHVLADELHRSGIEVSQATLSRDIQELGLIKASNAYLVGVPETPRISEGNLRRVLNDYVIQTESVPPLLVIKTKTGSASTVANAIDNAGWTEIVATIAGDDTIFALCRSTDGLEEALRRTEKLRI